MVWKDWHIFNIRLVEGQSGSMSQTLPANKPFEHLSAMSQAVWQKSNLSAVSQAVWQKTLDVIKTVQVLDKGWALAAPGPGTAVGAIPIATQKAEVCAPALDSKPQAPGAAGVGIIAGNNAAARPANEKPRPKWVKEPTQSALAIAEEVAGNAQVCWSGFIRPVDKVWEISSGFGPRWGRHHNGVDLAAPSGEPVLAADAGEVTFAGWEPSGYGYLVEVGKLLLCFAFVCVLNLTRLSEKFAPHWCA